MYYELTQTRSVKPIHHHEIPALTRMGRTVYFAHETPRISYHPRYVWVAAWLDPKSLRAAEIELRARDYNVFAERSMRWTVRWVAGRYSHEPRETTRPIPTDPGRIWIQVRVPAGFQDASANEKEDMLRVAARESGKASDLIRVAKNPSGEYVWLDLPLIGLVPHPDDEQWSPGDLVYIPSQKTWGRFWNFMPDQHFVEIGAVHVRSVPIDAEIRGRYRVGAYPAAKCIRILEDEPAGLVMPIAQPIAQAKSSKSGTRWSGDQVAAMS